MTPVTPTCTGFRCSRLCRGVRGRHRPGLPARSGRCGVARRSRPGAKHHPAGHGGFRDFSHLAPLLPQFIAERCVGCMACVSACPDSALIARVVPEADVSPPLPRFTAEDPTGSVAASDIQAQFARTKKYAEVPERHGTAPGAFGLFVEPTRCKGCGECVEVCAASGTTLCS